MKFLFVIVKFIAALFLSPQMLLSLTPLLIPLPLPLLPFLTPPHSFPFHPVACLLPPALASWRAYVAPPSLFPIFFLLPTFFSPNLLSFFLTIYPFLSHSTSIHLLACFPKLLSHALHHSSTHHLSTLLLHCTLPLSSHLSPTYTSWSLFCLAPLFYNHFPVVLLFYHFFLPLSLPTILRSPSSPASRLSYRLLITFFFPSFHLFPSLDISFLILPTLIFPPFYSFPLLSLPFSSLLLLIVHFSSTSFSLPPFITFSSSFSFLPPSYESLLIYPFSFFLLLPPPFF